MCGIPSSSSHALIGGFIGAVLAHDGWGVLNYRSIIEKVIVPLLLLPFIGFILMRFLATFFANAHPRPANTVFRRLQIGSSAFMAISHGMNDAQKTMGHKIFKLEPIHGFSAETSAATVILGASKRLSVVRWGIAGRLVIAWVITIPISACVGALSFFVINLILK